MADDASSVLRPMAKPPKAFGWLDFRQILESTSDSVLVIDRQWRYAYLNKLAIADISGGRDLVGQNVWKAFPELGKTKFGPAFRTAMLKKVATVAEDYFAPLDEWFSVKVYPVDGGLSVFFRRIGERKRAEAALARAERGVQWLYENLTLGVMFQDVHGTITQVNPAAERILGIPRAQLIGLTARDPLFRFIKTTGEPFSQSDYPGRIALETRHPVVQQIIGVHNLQLKAWRWLMVDVIPQFNDIDNTPIQICSVFSDITDQKRAEKDLHDSRSHLALAQRVASIGSAFLDVETGGVTWSDETYRIFGVDKKTFKPSYEAVLALVHPDDRLKYTQMTESAVRLALPYPLEYRIVRPDGETRTVYRKADWVRDLSGKITGVIGTTRDITDLRSIENQKEALQTQLYHAQRLDSLGTLAGGIAHDLNNTLVPILGLSEAMLSTLPAQSPQRPLLEVIHKAGERARDLVRQILQFSRRETADLRTLEIAPFLRETMRLARASVPASIIIKERFGKVPPIMGNTSQLHQIVLNLIANAAHAIGQNPGTITVELAKSDGGHLPKSKGGTGAGIRISVSDDGCGMDPAMLDRIFEPFFSTKTSTEGTGLGLSVVKGIVAGYGGRIVVTSKVGKGSRFDVYLPRFKPDAANPNTQRSAA